MASVSGDRGRSYRFLGGMLAILVVLIVLVWFGTRGSRAPTRGGESSSEALGLAERPPQRHTTAASAVDQDTSEKATEVQQDTCAVRGTVLDQESQPAEAAQVFILVDDPQPADPNVDHVWARAEAVSDSEGRFSTEVSPPCPSGIAAVSADETARGECIVASTRQMELECLLHLEEVWSLSGKVTDWENRPVAGARVSLSPAWLVEQRWLLNMEGDNWFASPAEFGSM